MKGFSEEVKQVNGQNTARIKDERTVHLQSVIR